MQMAAPPHNYPAEAGLRSSTAGAGGPRVAAPVTAVTRTAYGLGGSYAGPGAALSFTMAGPLGPPPPPPGEPVAVAAAATRITPSVIGGPRGILSRGPVGSED